MNREDPRYHPATVDAARQQYGFGLSWLVLMVVLPPLVYYLWICVRYYQGALILPRSMAAWQQFWSHVSPPTWTAAAFDVTRNDPVWGRPPEYLDTAKGSLLLTSGLSDHVPHFLLDTEGDAL